MGKTEKSIPELLVIMTLKTLVLILVLIYQDLKFYIFIMRARY